MIKIIKLEISPCNDNIENKDVIKELERLQVASAKACNKASIIQVAELERKNNSKNPISEKEVYGKSFSAYLETEMKNIMNGYQTSNVAQTRAFVMGESNFNKKEIKNLERSAPSYTLTNPIIIHNTAYNILNDRDEWFAEIGIFNLERQKELNVKRIMFKLPNVYSSACAILQGILDGKYKKGMGQITKAKNKNKWYFSICYHVDAKADLELSSEVIMGVDLGIVNTATYSIYHTDTNSYERPIYKRCMISGDELIKFRQKVETRKRNMSLATKWASDNKVGHGRKQRMRDANKMSDKVAKFRDTYNHKISRYLVDEAVRYGCGVIQMENLSGFSKEQENSMLKNWSYYDLQSKVKYKAEEKGIKLVLINPRFTSKRCSVCGNIHNLNRNCKEDQAKFECVACGHKMNADINASRNIALPNIEEIIRMEGEKCGLIKTKKDKKSTKIAENIA